MHKFLLIAAFSIAAGYLLTAPDVQPRSLGEYTYITVDGSPMHGMALR